MKEDRLFKTIFGEIKTGEKATIEDVITYMCYREKFEEDIRLFKIKDAHILEISELFSPTLIKEAVKENKNRLKRRTEFQIKQLQYKLEQLCG